MSVPIIDNTQSVLGYRAHETFSFMAGGSGSPEILYWTASSLPPGLSIDAPVEQSLTTPFGVSSTDILTCSAHGFANGDKVYFQSIAGGTGLSASTVYFVRDKTTDTFKLASTLTGAAINFTTDITAGQIRRCGSSLITGSVGTAATYVIGLNAINATGPSSSSSTVAGVPTYFTIGIEASDGSVPVSGSSDTGIDLNIDVATREVTIGTSAAPASGVPQFLLKEDDVSILNIRFKKSTVALDPNPTSIKVGFKELETEAVLFSAGGAVGTTWARSDISGDASVFFVPVTVTSDALASALSNYENDAGTRFNALCEIEWKQELPAAIGGVSELVSSTRTFLVTLERDLVV